MPRVAFLTFGILREPEGHPQVQGFFENDGAVFAAPTPKHCASERSGSGKGPGRCTSPGG